MREGWRSGLHHPPHCCHQASRTPSIHPLLVNLTSPVLHHSLHPPSTCQPHFTCPPPLPPSTLCLSTSLHLPSTTPSIHPLLVNLTSPVLHHSLHPPSACQPHFTCPPPLPPSTLCLSTSLHLSTTTPSIHSLLINFTYPPPPPACQPHLTYPPPLPIYTNSSYQKEFFSLLPRYTNSLPASLPHLSSTTTPTT
ncbi:hypothetical protein Pcinc_039250 [Petrolisthes cinctipes]|uniref:Uncharacterized protein n=1 Tax=Petrolisthes cinctipes TaxID=88211 RepID=A0AAE1BP92_PETCI|nr:hypothetical protein Pcinc_039250 [Petrolisthes cinctipes]